MNLGNDKGQALVITALCLTCVMGFVGLAIDVGILLRARRVVQNAADSAAIAAASELIYSGGSVSAAQIAAQQSALQNGVNYQAAGTTVAVSDPPASGAHSGQSGYVEVTITQPQPTFFMKLFYFGSPNIAARATGGPSQISNCIYALNSSGVDFLLNSNVTLSAPGCSIIDDSASTGSCGSAAMTVNAGSAVNVQSVGIVGGACTQGGGSISPAPNTGITAVSDPLASLPQPTISGCTSQQNMNSGNTYSLSPGCYNGLNINSGVTLNLQPGLYVINGGLNTGGTINGTGVTIFFTGQANFNSGTTLNLTAPTSGTYNGILFYEERGDTSELNVDANSGMTFEGIIYAPNANVTINGGGTSTTLYFSVVAGSFTLDNTITLNSYSAINSSNPLAIPALVE